MLHIQNQIPDLDYFFVFSKNGRSVGKCPTWYFYLFLESVIYWFSTNNCRQYITLPNYFI